MARNPFRSLHTIGHTLYARVSAHQRVDHRTISGGKFIGSDLLRTDPDQRLTPMRLRRPRKYVTQEKMKFNRLLRILMADDSKQFRPGQCEADLTDYTPH